MNGPVRDVRFDITANDNTRQAWDSAAKGADQFNNKLSGVEKRIQQASRGFTGSSKAIKLNNHQLQNLSFQLSDIGVMLASGQSPFVMMMQQGMQIGQIFGPGAGLAGAMKAVGTGMITFITNPINLAVVATAALAGGVGLLWDTFSGSNAKEAEAVQKRHSEWIDGLSNGYKQAQAEARKYQQLAERLPQSVQIAEGRDAAKELQAQYDQVRDKIIQGLASIEQRGQRVFDGPARGVLELVKKFRSGELTARQLQSAMGDVRLGSDVSPNILRLVKAIQDASGEASVLESRIEGIGAAVRKISNIRINPFANQLGIGDAVKQIRALAPELRTSKQQIDQAFRENISQARTIGEVNDLTKAYRETSAALVEQKRREDALTASRKSATVARRGARDAERELAQARKNTTYLADLSEEVRILGLSYHQRVDALKVLKEERRIRQAISRLGDNADAQQLATVRQLIPERMRLLDINRQDRQEIQRISQQYSQMGNAVGSALSGVINKTKSWKQAALEVGIEFAKIALQAQIFNRFGRANPTGNFLSSMVSSLFGGFFADGGHLGAGKWGVAGEAGPEIISGPANITPMTGGGAQSVHVTSEVLVSVADDGKLLAFVNSSGQQVLAQAVQISSQQIKHLNKGLRGRMGELNARNT